MAFFKPTLLIVAVAASMVSAGYHVSPPPQPTPVSPDCFTLFGHFANGTQAGFLNVYDEFFETDGRLANSSAEATKLHLDTSTGRLIDYDSNPDHNGLIASATRQGRYSSTILFETYAELQEGHGTDYIALTCELSSSGLFTFAHPANSSNYVALPMHLPEARQYTITSNTILSRAKKLTPFNSSDCTTGYLGLAIVNRDSAGASDTNCAPVTFSATAATSCVTPTSTFTLPAVSTITTTTTPTPTGAPDQTFICPGGEEPRVCADNFLVRCSDQAVGANVSWYRVPSSTSEYTCHELCVADPTCTGWNSYYEEIDLHSCSHTNDTFSPDTTFEFEYYFYSVGVRGFCQ